MLRQDEVAAVKALLGDRPRERALLIEYLHLIQDTQGCLPEGYLHALAEELSIPMAEVYEVATFYAHFDVVGDERAAPAKVTIRVCDSLSCMLAGAEKLLRDLSERPSEVRVVRAPCVGACDVAPAAEVGHHHVDHASAAEARGAWRSAPGRASRTCRLSGLRRLHQGRRLRRAARLPSGARKVEDVIATLSDGGLRGLGGAGFPTGRKWGLVRAEKGPRLMAVNGDEGEPGTFKDRFYLEREPHKFLEGTLIAAWAVEAARGLHLHPRRVPRGAQILAAEIPKLEAAGLAKHTKAHTSAAAPAPTSAARRAP